MSQFGKSLESLGMTSPRLLHQLAQSISEDESLDLKTYSVHWYFSV